MTRRTTAIAAAVVGAFFINSNPAAAQKSTCKFEGVPAATCQLVHRQIKAGWKDEVLVEPNGTTRFISRDMRGDSVQINLFAPGQKSGSFHSGTYEAVGTKFTVFTEDGGSYMSRGSQTIIYVDGGMFSYSL